MSSKCSRKKADATIAIRLTFIIFWPPSAQLENQHFWSGRRKKTLPPFDYAQGNREEGQEPLIKWIY